MAQAAAEANRGKVRIHDAGHYDEVYDKCEDQPHTLSRAQSNCYATAIGRPLSPEQIQICSIFLDSTVTFRYAEACFGSGKTLTAVASGVTYVSDNPNVRVAFLAETNAAVNAVVDAAKLGTFFNSRNHHQIAVRSKHHAIKKLEIEERPPRPSI
ncbi:Protein CBG26849 [Caenorhabditis briggsae]|uniref:Protein CBG26849 n=1 Tax=Caenorhabditis briggsae TaxID=6238 RepID=B6ILS3_CAEBR|nr:Protein CBG26849 [Caenorhabditis briggsae]CAS00853.1 Protein CBG26849 [Caenorhabditis briggsae]